MTARSDPTLPSGTSKPGQNLRDWAAAGHDWTNLLVDDLEATARIAAETDLDTLRAILATARRTGNLRWVIALCDRIAQLSPTPQAHADRVRSRLHANDLVRARALLKDLPAEMRPRERAFLDFDLAEANADAAAAADARARVASTAVNKDAAAAASDAALSLREALIRLSTGDLNGAGQTLNTARAQGASEPALAVLEVRLTLLTDGPTAALAALDDRSGVLMPTSAEWRAMRLRLLNARGRWAEALDLALTWMPADASSDALPNAELLAQALDAALMSDRLSELYARLSAIEQRYPDVPTLVETLCICAIEDDDQPAIQDMMERMRRMDRWRWLGLALRLACHTGATNEVDGLRALIRAEGCLWHGPDVMTALFSYYFEVTPNRLSALVDEMEPLFNRSFEDAGLQALRLRLNLALSRDDAARRWLALLPAGLRRCGVLQPFEMYFSARDGDNATALQGWRRWVFDTAPIATDARASYPQTVRLRFDPKPGAILCFVCIFNGIEYVDWFLDHYRRLGVDHFFFCDNASTDGTAERLLEQDDVSLFHASDSFAAAGCGIFWINHLMRRFGVGHWCVHVDMDEALIFPGYERGLDLRDLTQHMDERGHGCTSGAMIDMVPPGFPFALADGLESSTFANSTCFEPNLMRMPCELPPYAFIKGGVRSRLTGRSLLMTKSPLVRMSADFAYLVNNHHHTHLPVSDVTTAVLHYKFIGSFRERLEEAISRREHFQGARFYRQLDRSLDAPSTQMQGGALTNYESPAQLRALGLLQSTPEWDATLPRAPSRTSATAKAEKKKAKPRTNE